MSSPRRSSSSSAKPLRRLPPMTSLRSLLQSALSLPECYPYVGLPRSGHRPYAISALAPRDPNTFSPKTQLLSAFGTISERARHSFTETRSPKTSTLLYFSLFLSICVYFCLLLSTLELLATQFAVFANLECGDSSPLFIRAAINR